MKNKVSLIKGILIVILIIMAILYYITRIVSFLPDIIEGNKNIQMPKDSIYFDKSDSTFWIYRGENTFEKMDSLNYYR
jgi:hypothetical protein